MTKQLTLGLGLGVIGVYMAAVAQGPLYDKVIVDLPYPVTINNQRLEPGEYVIREMQSAAKTRVLQIFKDGGTTFETSAMTIPTLDNNTPEDTKVVLHKVGNNEYYFDKIWIQGKNYGYEFVLPEEVRNRQRESSTVAGRFVPMNQQSTTSSTTTPADTAATTGTAAARSTVNDSTTASNQTTTGTSTPGFAQSTENNRFTTSDSADNNSRATSNDLTAQNRTTGSDAAQQATTPRSTASDAAAQQSTPRSTPRMTSSDAASQTAAEQRTLSGITPADANQTTTGSRTAGTLPSTAGNWMALLLCGSALTSLGYAVSRRS